MNNPNSAKSNNNSNSNTSNSNNSNSNIGGSNRINSNSSSNNNNNNNGVFTTQQDIDFLLVDDYGALLLPPPNSSTNQQPQRPGGIYQAQANPSMSYNPEGVGNAHQQVAVTDGLNLSSRGPLHVQMSMNNNTALQLPVQHEGQQKNIWTNAGMINLNQQQQFALLQQQQQQQQQVQQRVFFAPGNTENQTQQQNVFIGTQIQAPNSASAVTNGNVNIAAQPSFPTAIAALNQITGQQFPTNASMPMITAHPNPGNLGTAFLTSQNQNQISAGNVAISMRSSIQPFSQTHPPSKDESAAKKRPLSSSSSNRQIKTRISKDIPSTSNTSSISGTPLTTTSMQGSSLPLSSMNTQGTSASTPTSRNKQINSTQSSAQSTKQAENSDEKPENVVSKEMLDNFSPEERRRYDRNLREQQRSMKISQQIKELRALLTDSHIPFKPNKYSILMSVVDYVKELQTRAVYLDGEHRKLVNTISRTSEIVNSGRAVDTIDCNPSTVGMESELLFVHDIDYKLIFSQCGAALGVAALDGRFIDCNPEFESISGLSKTQLKQGSLFNLLTPSDMKTFFHLIGEMLKSKDKNTAKPGQTFWSGVIAQKHGNFEVSTIRLIYIFCGIF